MRHPVRQVPLSVLLLISLTALANENEPHTTLDPLVVTATSIPTKTSNVIAQTTVIDRKTLANYQGKTVQDVLANQAGITVTQNGGLGTSSNFYLRGYNSGKVLVLIDGVRYGSATTGTPALNLIPTDQIDRIEILHGASGTSLYGADAVAGVIAIFSKGKTGTNGVSASVGAGSHSQYLASVNGKLGNETTSLALSASHSKTDGIDAIKQTSTAHDEDLDGYKSTAGSVSFSHTLNDKISIGINGLYNQSTTDYDSGTTLPAYAKQKNGAVSAFGEYKSKIANTRLSVGQSYDKSTSYDQYSPKGGQFDTTQNHARLDSKIAVNDKITVIAGAEHLTQKVDSTTNYLIKKRNVTSGFVGYQINEKWYDTQGNLRIDDNSQFGNHTNYNVGFAIKSLTGLRFGANYATGFRVPTFNELYYPRSGNPNLRPEQSKNSELFAEYSNKQQRTRLTAYRNDVENLIASSLATNWRPSNINQARMQGVSLTSDWRFDNGLLFGLGGEYLNAENLSAKDSAGKPYQLVYSPKNSYSAYVGYARYGASIKLEGKKVGERFGDVNNNTLLKEYTLLNLAGGYQFNRHWRMDLRVNNLTNEKYILINSYGTAYNTDGRNYFGSVTYTY